MGRKTYLLELAISALISCALVADTEMARGRYGRWRDNLSDSRDERQHSLSGRVRTSRRQVTSRGRGIIVLGIEHVDVLLTPIVRKGAQAIELSCAYPDGEVLRGRDGVAGLEVGEGVGHG